MKRIPMLLGTAVALPPLLLMGAVPAGAATGSLTVTALARNGKAFAAKLHAVNLGSGKVYTLTSGKAKALPTGTYDVLGLIDNASDRTDTIGIVQAKVAGATRATLDARKGKAVSVSLKGVSAPSWYWKETSEAACVTDTTGRVTEISPPTYQDGHRVYVIPESLTNTAFAYAGEQSMGIDGLHPDTGTTYMYGGRHLGGLPAGVSAAYTRSKLAKVVVHSLKGPTMDSETNVELAPAASDGCTADPDFDLPPVIGTGTLPYTFTAYVQPGSWSVYTTTANDFQMGTPHSYSAGSSHTLTVNRAVWGPTRELPAVDDGHLQVDISHMFQDPGLDFPYGESFLTSAKVTAELQRSSKVLVDKTYAVVNASAPLGIDPALPGTGWYTLSLSAVRDYPGFSIPSGTLSTHSSLKLHFDVTDTAVDQQVPGYLTQFLPTGLNTHDQAAPRKSTTVTLHLSRPASADDASQTQLSDSVKGVQAWYSTNQGSTWHATTVKHSGSTWTATIKNPASGAVSLRAETTDSRGDTATTTVIRAYGIS